MPGDESRRPAFLTMLRRSSAARANARALAAAASPAEARSAKELSSGADLTTVIACSVSGSIRRASPIGILGVEDATTVTILVTESTIGRG